MRVLAATTTFKPDLCEAISKNIVGLYNEISSKAEVTLLAPGASPPESVRTDFSFESFSNSNPYGSGRALFSNLWKLSAYLKRTDVSEFDLLHLHVGFCIELFFLSRAARRMSIPVMVTVWQPYLELSDIGSIFKQGRLSLIKGALSHVLFNSFLFRPFYWIASKAYSKIIVSSACQKEQILKFAPANRVEQIANGVAVPAEEGGERKSAALPRLLYLGHYTPAKGVDCILEGLSLLKEKTAFQMTFALSDRGNVERFRTLVDQYGLHDYVTVKGGVDVHEEMCQHDLFLIPYTTSVGVSYYPNVVMECFASGLPMVSTTIPVMRELLEDVDENLLVPINDPAALANQVVCLLRDQERLGDIGNKLKKMHKVSYALPVWAKRNIEEYKKLLKGASQ